MTTATPAEARHFYWHCAVAAMVIDSLPSNAATSSHALRAVRMATLTAVGKKGVMHASAKAKAVKESSGQDWHKCGLIKEHVVPVSAIHEHVLRDLDASKRVEVAEGLAPDIQASGLPSEVVKLFLENPMAWQVAKVVRDLTVLAWVTREEHALLGGKGPNAVQNLTKSMPGSWDGQDRFARYTACGIELSPT